MVDITNLQLSINDIVYFNPPKYKGLTKGLVVGFTDQKVRVKFNKHHKLGTPHMDANEILQLPNTSTFLTTCFPYNLIKGHN